MVQHGRNRKRRAGRTGRTKLKNRSWKRWDTNPKISDPVIKKLWDVSKSPAANLSQLGITAHPNKTSREEANTRAAYGTQEDTKEKQEPKIIELFDVPDSDTPKQRQYPMDKNDEEYIAKCMDKFGEDYTSMFRDVKGVNKMQHTETQLRKLGARYLLLTPEQRRVEVPESLKQLIVQRE